MIESAVIGIENKDLGETVVAVIVLDRLELTENDILLDLKKILNREGEQAVQTY